MGMSAISRASLIFCADLNDAAFMIALSLMTVCIPLQKLCGQAQDDLFSL